METWFDSFIEAEETEKKSVRTAVLLAKVRYDEQLAPFVRTSADRLEYVKDEIARIVTEVSDEVKADPVQVSAKLMTVIADSQVELPITEPERVDVTDRGDVAPPAKNTKEVPEPDATTSVLDHGAVLEDAIEADKTISVQGSCVRCAHEDAVEDSPVCATCNDEIVALAAPVEPVKPMADEDKDTFQTGDDSPPLDEAAPLPYAVGDRVVLVKGNVRGLEGTVAEVVKDSGDGRPSFALELDQAYEGVTRTPPLYEEAFARVRGDKAKDYDDTVQGRQSEGAVEDLIWKSAYGEQYVPQQVGQPAAPPAGAAQPLNPNAPYQCVVCGFTGTFDAVNQHLAAANDTPHMQAKDPNYQQQPAQAPATAPPAPVVGQQPAVASTKEAAPGDGGPPLGPPPGEAAPPPAPTPSDEKVPGADDDRGPVKDPIDTAQQTPEGHFDQITQAMANRAAAREYSVISDSEAQALANQYGLDPEEIKSKVVVQATFGDFSATNGDINGDSAIPQGYVEVGLTGAQGKVDGHQAIVPVNSAVKKVSDDLGMDPHAVYDAIKEAFGGDLSSEFHTKVNGEHHFYLPQEYANQAEPAQQQQPAPAPQPAQPAQQAPVEQQMPQIPEEQMGI